MVDNTNSSTAVMCNNGKVKHHKSEQKVRDFRSLHMRLKTWSTTGQKNYDCSNSDQKLEKSMPSVKEMDNCIMSNQKFEKSIPSDSDQKMESCSMNDQKKPSEMEKVCISNPKLEKCKPSEQKLDKCSISSQKLKNPIPHDKIRESGSISNQEVEIIRSGDQNVESTSLSGQKSGSHRLSDLNMKNPVHNEQKSSTVQFVGDKTAPPSSSICSSKIMAKVSLDQTKCDSKSESLEGEGSFAECPDCKSLVIRDLTMTQYNRGVVEVMPCCPNWQVSIAVVCLLCFFLMVIRKWLAKL